MIQPEQTEGDRVMLSGRHPLELARAAEQASRVAGLAHQALVPSEAPESWTRLNGKEYPRLEHIQLPHAAQPASAPSLRHAIESRRSTREFSGDPVPLSVCATLLADALRARPTASGLEGWTKPYPSAGARWPIESYLVSVTVDGLREGLYHYDPFRHQLSDCRHAHAWSDLSEALGDGASSTPAFAVILSGAFSRSWQKYGARGSRFVQMEAGAAAMTLTLAASALELVGFWIGGFVDDRVASVLDVDWNQELEAPLLILPFGIPRRD